ncbi:hypothetical protein GCM10010428_81160 [Actinosynnema pretiosum subsp. pretiosum]
MTPCSEFARGWYLWPGGAGQFAVVDLVRPVPDEVTVLDVNGYLVQNLAVRAELVRSDFRTDVEACRKWALWITVCSDAGEQRTSGCLVLSPSWHALTEIVRLPSKS